MHFRTPLVTLVALAVHRSYAAPRAFSRRGQGGNPIPFSPGYPVQLVVDLAQNISSHSWEFGTATETLLELYNPELSIFGAFPFEAAKKLGDGQTLPRGLAYAQEKIVIGTGPNALSDGDGAVGDPASLGVGAVLLGKRSGNEKFAAAAKATVDYVTTGAPRAPNGAISHRVAYVELWADFIYMVPPFLAYYAADTANITLLREAVNQCQLYRDSLQANDFSSFSGLWHHIEGPVNQDLGLWSTGNAWAAAGMTRVLATVLKAPFLKSTDNSDWRGGAVLQLTSLIKEIVDGAIDAGADSYEGGLAKNYFDQPKWFGETSGSSLLAATVYRMAVLSPGVFGLDGVNGKYVKWAEGIRKTLGSQFVDSNSGETLDHVDRVNGTVRPAVNPLGWGDTKPWMTGSPEGQSFATLLYAAWRDCVFASVCERD
ncbi:putative glycosyl hydrolase family 88 [Lyophyllum shimeji]|uniref:Glycosyl hydrolase family 88 n=1 Tax=Lyophyllum shimeji TaxID=47721 RepID=A0A9P3UPI0_LYOSH|nr:putative glycosyl hydrolase family 88 [Lyophyllum shimeji]